MTAPLSIPNITWYCHRHLDEVELVVSEFPDRAYHCPSIDELDTHLRTLLEHLGPKSNLTEIAQMRTRRDVDRLLERRTYLRLVCDQAAA